MGTIRSNWTIAFAAVLGLLPTGAGAARGAQIYELQPQRPAVQAGLAVGDIVQAATTETAESIDSALDLMLVEMRWGDLRPVELRGASNSETRDWTLTGNGWGVKSHPFVDDAQRAPLVASLKLLEAGETAQGCTQLLEISNGWTGDDRGEDRRWAQFRCLEERIRKKLPVGELAAEVAAGAAADPEGATLLTEFFRRADSEAAVVNGLLAVKLAGAAFDATNWALLEQLLAQAGAAFATEDPRLQSLADLRRGKSLVIRGQFADVLGTLEPTAANLREHAPGSLRLAAVQNEIAWANLNLGQSAKAEALLRDTLRIARERQLNGVDLSKYQGHLAMVLHARGDLVGAEREIRTALDRLIAMQAGDKFIAPVWNNLGVIRRERGDYIGAEDAFRQTLAMEERRDPGWVSVAIAYGNLASITRLRGDLVATEQWAERARAIIEKAAPEGTESAQNFHLLGSIALDRDELNQAQARFESAIAVWNKIAPRSPRHAVTIDQLGVIAQRRGEIEQARAHYETALAIQQEAVPDSAEVGSGWWRLGSLELEQGSAEKALPALEKAVAIGERRAPEALGHARALNALGRAELALGHRERALERLCRASAVLDRSRARISRDPKEQADALAQYSRIRSDCVAAQAAAGDPTAAFDTLERGRGRAMLALLSRRDLTFADDLPAPLRREWAALEADITRLQTTRSRGKSTPAESAEIHARLRELDTQQKALIERLRIEAPRFAALQFPQSLDFAAVRERLPADTALVSFVQSALGNHAIVVRRDLDAPVTRPLRDFGPAPDQQIAQLRAALFGDGPPGAADTLARTWHTRLIAPIRADLAGIERLVLIPDAAYFALPFAALQDGQGRYLIESFSLSIADSATLWASEDAGNGAPGGLLAVANAEGSTGAAPDATRGAVAELPPLPYARVEVDQIRALDRERTTVVADAAATEATVASLARGSGRVHFAVHSLFDPIAPLESGLVLRADASARGSGADGVLQAWEIFEGWRTDADLVTLSGCDTGQGKALADEGLVGLTRAFQFAGARNVVASLWSVSDRSTAQLMTRFYAELAAGKSVDRALQAAQIAMLRDPKSLLALAPSPDHERGVGGLVGAQSLARGDATWAAFQVYGRR